MESLEIIINGIIKLSTFNITKEIYSEKIILKGKKGTGNSIKEIILKIEKSEYDEGAFVTLNMYGEIHSLDIHISILYDILHRTNLIDSRLSNNLDILLL